MNVDNKTIVIVGLIILGIGALFFRFDELALAIGSGLVGYLSKDVEVYLKGTNETEDDFDET